MNNTILFDLDGTLTLPEKGVVNGIKYMCKRLNLKEPSAEEIKNFIGPPLQQTFRNYYFVNKEQSQHMVDVYREYYANYGLCECELPYGIEGLLATLKAQGKTLAVATCKPQKHAELILKSFDLAKYFSKIFGANLTEKGSDKPSIIAKAIKELNAENSTTVMVGDGEGDILGAKKCGIKSVGVLYGYGTEQSLKNAGADIIVKTPYDLLCVL